VQHIHVSFSDTFAATHKEFGEEVVDYSDRFSQRKEAHLFLINYRFHNANNLCFQFGRYSDLIPPTPLERP